MTKEETILEARALYAPRLRYAEVLTLAKLFGYTECAARNLVEGLDAPIKGRAIGPSTRKRNGAVVANNPRKYYDRDEIIAAL